MQYKIYIVLFILFIFISSETFINSILTKFNDSVNTEGVPTVYGNVIQGIFFVLIFVCIDFLIQNELL